MKTIILIGISFVILTLTRGTCAQSEPDPPLQLVIMAKHIASYLKRNYAFGPNRAILSKEPTSDHNSWFLSWEGPDGLGFCGTFDLENKMLLNMSDEISERENEACKRAGAPISVTALQANEVVENFQLFLEKGNRWRTVNTYLSSENDIHRVWSCKYSLFVEGYFSREENTFCNVNAYNGTIMNWWRLEPRTYIRGTGALLSFHKAQQITSKIAKRDVIVQAVYGLATQTDPLWTDVAQATWYTPICRLAYVFEIVPLPGEGQFSKAIAVDAHTGEFWFQSIQAYMTSDARRKLKSPGENIISERFKMIDKLIRDKSLAPLIRSIASGNPLKHAPKEKPLAFERVAGQFPIAFSLYLKSRALSWTASTGNWTGVQLSKPEMALLRRWLSINKTQMADTYHQ